MDAPVFKGTTVLQDGEDVRKGAPQLKLRAIVKRKRVNHTNFQRVDVFRLAPTKVCGLNVKNNLSAFNPEKSSAQTPW